jgi:uncharacterized protein YkwD
MRSLASAVALTVLALTLLATTNSRSADAAGPLAGSGPSLLASPGECPNQTDRSLPARTQMAAMRCMINHARRAAGVTPLLRPSGRLAKAARRKAADIVRCSDFSHTACGRAMAARMRGAGYTQGRFRVGENIAWGSGSRGTVRSIMRGWLSSPPHRRNLLSPRFRDHGVGLRIATFDGVRGAAVWTHELGVRR